MRVGSVAQNPAAAAEVVEARRTPASMTDIRGALSRALQAATGQRPSAQTLDVLSAQVSLETARGGQMFNFNFGGIKGVSPQGQTANYMTHEVIDGADMKLSQGFRAYGSIDEGARDYVSFLKAHYPQALARAGVGDVAGFAHALKEAHYYTAPEAQYAAGLQAAVGHAIAAPAAAEQLQAAPTQFSTSAELSNVLDAISRSAMKIAEPEPEDE